MRKYYFTFLCITSFFFNVQAQYIFNGCSNRPAYGDSLTGILNQYDSTGVKAGSAGANITWNYTNLLLTNTSKISHYYKDPTTTIDTSATSNLPLFPTANLADFSPNGVHSYYQYTPDSVTYLGNYIDIHNYQLVSGSEKQIICPLSFGNSFYNSFSIHPVGICTSNSYINRTITYDAYGTLNTPHASYSVARLKMIEQEIDSSCTPHLPPAFKVDTTYTWFDINTGQPVFSWEYYNDTSTHYINKYIQEYSYSHLPVTVATSVLPVAEQQFEMYVYPNPAITFFTIEGTSKSGKVHYSIVNIVGSEVQKGDIATYNNGFSGEIKIDNILTGMYFIKVTDDKNTWTTKLNVHRE